MVKATLPSLTSPNHLICCVQRSSASKSSRARSHAVVDALGRSLVHRPGPTCAALIMTNVRLVGFLMLRSELPTDGLRATDVHSGETATELPDC